MRGLGLFLGVSRIAIVAAAVVLVPGAEIWPQPIFAAGTGLNSVRGTIASNKWTSNASGFFASCGMATPPTIAAGEQYQYSVTVDTIGSSPGINIGGVTVDFLHTGVNSGTVTVLAGGLAQIIRVQSSNDTTADVISACSVRKMVPA